jgi:serine/threonine-protein kinase
MSVRRALEIGLWIALALERAHERGLVHGDLRPRTIRVREALEDAQIVPPLFVHDYGPGTLPVHGIPPQEYTAPERSRGATHANDLYSLGCILMELLTGSPPFVGHMSMVTLEHERKPPPVPSTRRPELSPAIDACVLRLLAKEPAERFASARELATALAELLALQDGGNW